jgi:hypothetical protein
MATSTDDVDSIILTPAGLETRDGIIRTNKAVNATQEAAHDALILLLRGLEVVTNHGSHESSDEALMRLLRRKGVSPLYVAEIATKLAAYHLATENCIRAVCGAPDRKA